MEKTLSLKNRVVGYMCVKELFNKNGMYVIQNWVFRIFNYIHCRCNLLYEYNLIRNVVL